MADVFEIKRKIFHFVGGLTLIALIYLDILNPLGVSVLLSLMVLTSLVCKRTKIPIVNWLIENIERGKYKETFPGKAVVFFLSGTLLALLIFGKELAIVGLLILTLGDGVSSLVGIHYGRIKHPFSNVKFIEGHISGAIVAFAGIMLLSFIAKDFNVSLWEALFASVIAMFIEGIEVEFKLNEILDDNIVLPLIGAFVVWVIRLL